MVFQSAVETKAPIARSTENLQVNSKLEILTILKKTAVKKDDMFELFAQFVQRFSDTSKCAR